MGEGSRVGVGGRLYGRVDTDRRGDFFHRGGADGLLSRGALEIERQQAAQDFFFVFEYVVFPAVGIADGVIKSQVKFIETWGEFSAAAGMVSMLSRPRKPCRAL